VAVGVGIALAGTVLPGIVKEFFAERSGTMTGVYLLAMMVGAATRSSESGRLMIRTETLAVPTEARVELIDVTDQLTGLVRDSRADLNPALQHLGNVLDVLNKNEDNLDNSLRLMAPFYRVFANTLGDGPWFETFIKNLPPVPQVGLPTAGAPAVGGTG